MVVLVLDSPFWLDENFHFFWYLDAHFAFEDHIKILAMIVFVEEHRVFFRLLNLHSLNVKVEDRITLIGNHHFGDHRLFLLEVLSGRFNICG